MLDNLSPVLAADQLKPLREFLSGHASALLHAAGLLGGAPARRRTSRLLLDIMSADHLTARIQREIVALRALLRLENVDNDTCRESGFFAMINPSDPVVEQICLLTDQLAVQGFADVETLGGPSPVSLYALTVARSGERKSASDAPLMAGLRAHEREQGKAQREATESWRNSHALWAEERKRILAEAKQGKGEKRVAAQADLQALGPEPSAPPSADRTVTEPTFEGLTRLFAHGQPALGIFSDEGGQYLGGHAMNADNRQKTLAALNGLWSDGTIKRTRSADGHTTLYGRRLAVHLMVQPFVARSFMADPTAADTGFLPRCLICEPPTAIGTRFARNARRDDGALAAFSGRLREILDTPLPMDPETRELEPRILPLAPDARALLVAFSDAIEAAQAPGGNLAHITPKFNS